MLGVTLHVNYPDGILYDTPDGILYPLVSANKGYHVFDNFQPTQALSTILLDIHHCADVGFLIKPRTKAYTLWPTGLLAYSNSRISEGPILLNKNKVALVFKGDFYLHNADNTVTLLTIDTLPEHIEKILTIQG